VLCDGQRDFQRTHCIRNHLSAGVRPEQLGRSQRSPESLAGLKDATGEGWREGEGECNSSYGFSVTVTINIGEGRGRGKRQVREGRKVRDGKGVKASEGEMRWNGRRKTNPQFIHPSTLKWWICRKTTTVHIMIIHRLKPLVCNSPNMHYTQNLNVKFHGGNAPNPVLVWATALFRLHPKFPQTETPALAHRVN